VPEAELRVSALRALPFPDASFDLVVTNDVLQHVPEADVGASLAELRRVLDPQGVLFIHTNG
jgi:ubiquinone/menaquinone biosynthesis C-methylase UbiE